MSNPIYLEKDSSEIYDELLIEEDEYQDDEERSSDRMDDMISRFGGYWVMKTKPKRETKDLKEQLKDDAYKDFFKHMGINPDDFEELEDDINFDDYSH